MEMKALVLRNKGCLQLEKKNIPSIGDHEVLIKIKNCGICGSDIPRALEGQVHFFPLILGHEFSGKVVQTGRYVTSVTEGDRVTAAPLITCGNCEFCKKGKPAMCLSYRFIGSSQDGAMAEYISVDEKNVVKLPDDFDYQSGALIEPLTVALHGIERINLRAGANVILFGAGTIGLLTLQCLKVRGAGKVYVVDINDDKLALAQFLGADEVINSLKTDVTKYFNDTERPDVAIETAGVPITQRQCLEVVSKLGSVIFIGTAHSNVQLPPKTFEKILRGELFVTGSWMSYSAPFPGYEWTTAIQYIKEGKIDVKPLITNIFKLEDGMEAFRVMNDPEINSVKVMFEID